MMRSYVAPRETSSRRDVVVDRWPPFAPDGEVDRLQIAWVVGVYVRTTIEQKIHHLTTGAEDGTVGAA